MIVIGTLAPAFFTQSFIIIDPAMNKILTIKLLLKTASNMAVSETLLVTNGVVLFGLLSFYDFCFFLAMLELFLKSYSFA